MAFVLGVAIGFPHAAQAGQLSSRRLQIDSPSPSAVTNHTFGFTFANTTAVGSVVLQYCTMPLFEEPCFAPAGVNVASALLLGQAGETGFTIGSTTANSITLTRAPQPVTTPQVSYKFGNITNPSTQARTFFARITSYASTDGSGTAIDAGSVANSTAQAITLSTEVPPILNFCVGNTIPGDCAAADGNFLQLGNLSAQNTATGNSQFWVGTNAQNGYSVTASGTTMTSGTNIIPALATPTFSAPGTNQFGMNLRANTVPAVGQEPAGPGPALPSASYNVPNQFAYTSLDVVASTGIPADWQRFTVSYIVNVSPTQPAGIYSTTLTYVCSAGF